MDWLGLAGGKNAGREYLPLNPKREDRTPGSLSINRDKGMWMEGATGDKGGDLVSLAAYLWDCSNTDAAEQANPSEVSSLGWTWSLIRPTTGAIAAVTTAIGTNSRPDCVAS